MRTTWPMMLAFVMGMAVVAWAADRSAAPTVRDFGAAGDGTADDTAAFQKAVDAGAGDIRLPRGRYRLTRTVVVDLDRVGPTCFQGTGAATVVMAGPGPALRFVGTHEGTAAPRSVKPNVWTRQRSPAAVGFEIVGAHPAACGIEATGTMQLTLARLTVRKTLHAVHLVKRNRNVIVSACHLYENRGVGLYLDDVDLHQINVVGSHISYNGGGGIVVRAGNVRNLHVTGCDIEGNMDADGPATANVLIDSAGGKGGCGEVAIVGCTIQHTRGAPGSANVRVIGTDGGGVRRGNVLIADNVLSDVHVNVHVAKARGVSIVGNTFWQGQQHNLLVEDTRSLVVGPNLFDRAPSYQRKAPSANALLFRRCQDATVTGLHVFGVGGVPAGIVLEDCRRFNVTGCTVLDCEGAGMLLKNVSDSRLSDCLIRHAEPPDGWRPVVVQGGSGNAINAGPLGRQP
ncbi:MAG: right-handed parallel beta-helix repeat-containing protein [Planctomycetota bacterium]|nr:right-handed parallel beta-helix repeat-containing protein [Planctomycetota bacterium]